ncbi:MAG: hypothetical protein Q4Q17_01405 [Tissierellia bacterium]|nr:hypothetical protein [Tissierellia bacterium]
MPETWSFTDEFGQRIEFIVQARFYVCGQEYVAMRRLDRINEEPVFFRVEVGSEGQERLMPPLFSEREEVEKTYLGMDTLVH